MENPSEEIQRACRLGDLDLLKAAIDKCPGGINESDSKLGWTGLYRSVICGHYNTSEYLLLSGAEPNLKTKMGDTALHQAADNKQYQLAKLLLKYKADPDMQQNDGETPLHLACFKGDSDMASILLQNHANPNIQNHTFGKSPLHYAVDYSYISIVTMLMQYNASPDIKDKHGKTSKDIARTSEIQILLGISNSIYIPSPEPSDIVEKGSFCLVSPIMSRSNSDISINSDYKSVEVQVKQLEDIHKKIREKVRGSVDTVRNYGQSQNTSLFFEPDAEKSGFEILTDKNKIVSFGGTERNPELYNWLCKKRLEGLYGVLISAGYDDLAQLTYQMESSMPITEQSLMEIGVNKQGYRKRLLYSLDALVSNDKENMATERTRNFSCCTASIPSNLWVINMPTLEKWLERLNLKESFKLFVDAGYDDLEEMLGIVGTNWEITGDDLVQIGINKPGYRHRILSKLIEDSQECPRKKTANRNNKNILTERNTNNSACDLCKVF